MVSKAQLQILNDKNLQKVRRLRQKSQRSDRFYKRRGLWPVVVAISSQHLNTNLQLMENLCEFDVVLSCRNVAELLCLQSVHSVGAVRSIVTSSSVDAVKRQAAELAPSRPVAKRIDVTRKKLDPEFAEVAAGHSPMR